MNSAEFFTRKWVVLGFFTSVFIYGWYFAAPLSAIIIGLGGNLFLGYVLSAPKYKGLLSQNFDGKNFQNPTGVKPSGFPALVKWLSSRKRTKWELGKDFLWGEKPPASINKGVRITFINHSSFLIQIDGLNILTDPIWSERASPFTWIGPKRKRPPGIRFDDLPEIHILLISHNHYDHLDISTLKLLAEKFQPKIFTPLGVKKFLETNRIQNATDMDWWQQIAISDELQLASVPAQHFSGRGAFDRDATLWSGFVIKRKSGNIYFAGDTGYNDSTFVEIGKRFAPISVALLPIGAYKPQWFMSPIHTSPADSVKIHLDLEAQESIATHFGTFALADEGADEPIIDLQAALEDSGVPEDDFIVMKEGSAREFS
jgi:L-ascorbate metabolism protein UlaG (beta-lactamase superfamily)